MKSFVRALTLNYQIKTTAARAKELRGYVEKLLTKVQSGQPLAIERYLAKGYDAEVIKKLKLLGKKYSGGGGYTQVIKALPRKSDGSEMAVIRFAIKK